MEMPIFQFSVLLTISVFSSRMAIKPSMLQNHLEDQLKYIKLLIDGSRMGLEDVHFFTSWSTREA